MAMAGRFLGELHPGGQPQRGQRGALQRQRTSECIAGTVERDHEAVALALLDRTYRVVIGDESGEGAIELDDRRRRLLRLGFPQVGRSLDSANSNVTVPVGKVLIPGSLQSARANPRCGFRGLRWRPNLWYQSGIMPSWG